MYSSNVCIFEVLLVSVIEPELLELQLHQVFNILILCLLLIVLFYFIDSFVFVYVCLSEFFFHYCHMMFILIIDMGGQFQ